MESVQIDELERDAPKYFELAKLGETLSITENQREVFQIVPVPQPSRQLRPIGLCDGQFTVPDDFDDPLPADVLADWYGKD